MPRDFFDDARLLPVEKPEHRTWLQERLERRQISRLNYLLTPADQWGIGLELTSGARIAFWAQEDTAYYRGHGKYRYRVFMRWIAPQRIITPRGKRYWGYGRDSGLGFAVTPHWRPDTPVEQADDLQQRVEGEFIVGAAPTYEPNAEAGERLILELKGGGKLHLDALPPRPGSRDRADMAVDWIAPPARTHIVMPGADF